MTETVLISGFIYLACYRVAVIATGVICMILGFRLLLSGMPGTDKGAEISVSVPDFKLKAASIAPGTCFAVFGVIVITVTLAGDKPEINLLKSVAENQMVQSVKMRGDVDNKRIGELINDVAWKLYDETLDKRGLLELARSLAEGAVDLFPYEKNYLDTLNKIQDQLRR